MLAFGNLESGLLTHPSFAGSGGLVAKFVLYLVPLLGVLGGGLALVRPRLGSILLLLSAVSWLAVAFIAGHGAILFAALPFTFVAAGGIVALTGRRSESSREMALAAPVRPKWSDEEDEDDEEEEEEPPPPRHRPASAAPRRSIEGRSEPDFGQVMRRQAAVPVDRFVEEEPEEAPRGEEEEDFVDAEEAVEEEAPPYETEPYAEDEAEEPPEAESEDDAGESPPTTPAQRAGRGQWSLPEPEESPAPRRTQQRYAPDQQRPPARRQILPRRFEPAPPPVDTPDPDEVFDISDADFAPPRRQSEPQPRSAYRDFDPYDRPERDDDDGRRERRSSPLRSLLRLLVLILVVLVVGGIGAWVYFDYKRGPNSILFGAHQQASSTPAPAAAPKIASIPKPVAATPTPLAAPTPAPVAAAPIVPQPALSTSVVATPPAASAAAPAIDLPSADSPGPVALAPAAGNAAPADTSGATSFSNPFTYCSAVGTVDAPDSTYSGPKTPPGLARVLGLQPDTDQLHWRCANERVLVCNAKNGPACDMTPTVDMMIGYCAQHPDAKNLPAPNGSWNCNGKRPSIPRDQKWPVDARGFFPDAWKQVSTAPPAG